MLTYYRWRYHYDSGSYGDWSQTETTSVIPTITAVKKDGATYTNYSGNTVTIAQNTGVSTITYKVTGRYTDPNGYTWSNKTLDVSQAYVPYSYKNTQVSVVYRVIGAAANVGHPRITVSQEVWQGGSRVDTISGSITDGTTGGTASGSTITGIAFAITRVVGSAVSGTGASFSTTNGDVTTASRRTTEGPQRDVATGVYISILINGVEATNTSSATAEQAANSKGSYIDPVYTLVSINSLSTYNISDTCLDTDVTATVKATWTEGGYKYSSYYDGDTTNGYTGLTQHSNQTVTGSSTPAVTMRVNGTSDFSNSQNKFTVNNKYNTSRKDHSVVALFGTLQSYATTVTQKADSKSAWQSRDWKAEVAIGNNQIWAGGGQAAIVASGSHEEYKTWTDGSDAETRTITTDTPSLSLVNANNDNAYTGTAYSIVGTELRHRDMENNGTTDSVRVMATNTSASKKTGTISVTNNRSSVPEYGPWHDYGSSYSGNYAVDTFTAGAYTSSSSPAPRTQTTTTYSVTASHDTLIHQAKDAYYYYDSNYASAHGGTDHNDADHRDTVANADTSGTPRVVSHHTGDSVTFSYPTGQTWLTAAGGTITIAAQSQLGDGPRDGYIYATNAGGGNYKNVRLYQAPYAGFSVSQTSFMFPAEGGTYYTDVTAYYAAWDIHYLPMSTDPGVTFTAAGASYGTASGGNDDAVTTTRVTLTVSPYSQPGAPTQGEATLDARTRSEVPPVTITLKQYAQTS